MLSIWRMDFRRFRTNKVMGLLLLIYCAFQLFGIFMMNQYRDSMEVGGISFDMMDESEFFQYMLAQPPSWMLLYIAVFTVYFYMSEWSVGFYKNYITMHHARIYTVLSKVFILALFILLLFMSTVCVNMAGRQLFFGQVNIGDWGYYVKLLTGQFLLHWAFSVLVLSITITVRNLIAGLIIVLILALNVVGMALSALESLVDSIHISQYWVVNTIFSVQDFNQAGDVLRTLAVSVGFIVIFTFAAIQYKKREDLK